LEGNVTVREAFEETLSTHYTVRVLVIEHPDLVVPPEYDPAKRRLVLEYGLDMAKPIADLEVTDDGIKATLSFANEPHATFVPWGAINSMGGMGERPKQRTQLRSV
jgi:hypothetical protein